MFNEKITNEYINIVKEKPEVYYKDYLELVDRAKNSTAVFRGAYSCNYQGMFVSQEDCKEFQRIAEIIMKITRKVTDQYVKNPEYESF